ncbi:hypothetical protein HPP92_010746 [Vanilla planifolia]|uniref:Uncharacterized protein n=1 Tax=Vanilla planifolia TaxID=51239 RepID=A0A835V253_VANPL|nr:hypothetical protein HPP92_010997 [Vanilla planifolia]KAG0482662.1 hypothetical protein HPP92_010746 [Vanilla planifolia]
MAREGKRRRAEKNKVNSNCVSSFPGLLQPCDSILVIVPDMSNAAIKNLAMSDIVKA